MHSKCIYTCIYKQYYYILTYTHLYKIQITFKHIIRQFLGGCVYIFYAFYLLHFNFIFIFRFHFTFLSICLVVSFCSKSAQRFPSLNISKKYLCTTNKCISGEIQYVLRLTIPHSISQSQYIRKISNEFIEFAVQHTYFVHNRR